MPLPRYLYNFKLPPKLCETVRARSGSCYVMHAPAAAAPERGVASFSEAQQQSKNSNTMYQNEMCHTCARH